MVEGPGCKLNGEKLRRRAKGQVVKAISGTAVERKAKAKTGTSAFDVLIGMRLTDVLTLGKELFIIFEEDACVRIHFLMAGCLRFNNDGKEFGSTKIGTPTLKLSLNRDDVQFLGTSVEMRSSAECQQKYRELTDLDILSTTFNAKRATQTIMGQPERLICDVILDQMVLPGVGNIIKNEALFNAGINPNSKVSQLNEELVTLLVAMNRDFTKIFYKCRKEGKNLNKFMNVYKKGKCVECGAKLVQCKIGEYERLTFFCRACQNNTLRLHTKLPKRSSLLGWVVGAKNEVPWSCSACTLVNKPASVKCIACLTPKFHLTGSNNTQSGHAVHPPCSPLLTSDSSSTITTLSHSSPASTALSSPVSPTSGSSTSASPPSGIKRLLENDQSFVTNSKGKYKFRRLSNVSKESQQSHSSRTMETLPLSKKTAQKTTPLKDDKGHGLQSGIVLCVGHRAAAKKCRVVKDNENKGRIFYTCSKPASNQCNFFMWGDEHHPLCGHGKVSIIRTVLKQNANNGREFYCCPLPKKNSATFSSGSMAHSFKYDFTFTNPEVY